MRDFPPKARGPVLLALGGLRLCPDSSAGSAADWEVSTSIYTNYLSTVLLHCLFTCQ
ncbi:hypothetical protein PF008_g26222 [Phytophthora fragariae]|uniref:Uncharacterized protein n=1 Tax=Phytophthora fragariae TaxID=53985 RepID=A0A6G0QHU1_9STRA|nr:hypothetical protein PF008_g26222 [Phytophthora fragariae]